MLAGVFLQAASLLVSPMLSGEAPPETRAVRVLVVAADPAAEVEPAAQERMLGWAREVRAGADFAGMVRRHSSHPSATSGGVLGSFMPGVLAPEIDRFLFAAALGEVSEPLKCKLGLVLAQRIDARAGCRQILVKGSDAAARKRCEELLAKLRAGADFAELARTSSDDRESAARGGQLAIVERGPQDSLVKAKVFELGEGEIGGPVETPFGLHIVQRVHESQIDPALAETRWIRARGILVGWLGARGSSPAIQRSQEQALELARELMARIEAGADMAQLAREHDDDSGGRERSGDLGWLLRRSGQVPSFADVLFPGRVGQIHGPLPSSAGWWVVRRER